jgi:aspartyl-tRNA(Asn)/glutamyl-tRNA(Gln) amidotransferase subunit C
MSSTISDDVFLHTAKLSGLTINPNESFIKDQLSQTADYVEVLQELNTDNVLPTSQVNHKTNVLRDDIVTPSFSQDEALAQAAKTKNGYFVTAATIKK